MATKNKITGLGRGLSALLGDYNVDSSVVSEDSPSRIKAGETRKIPIDAIETNPWQPRNSFEEESLAELSESIKIHGLIQPIIVRKTEDEKYQLISGERRLRASKMAGLTHIVAYVRTASDLQMMEMALIENIQREDLNPMEIAVSLQRLMEECKITQENLADKVSKSRSAVTNYLRLLKLSTPVQSALSRGKISMGHARALVVVEDPDEQVKLMVDIIDRNMSVRQVEDVIRKRQRESRGEPLKKVKIMLPQAYQDARSSLSGKFNTSVDIHRDVKGKGSLIIKFRSDAEFERILSLLKSNQ